MTKELKNIEKALNEYIKKHNSNVLINLSIYAFNKKGIVIDDMVFQYGADEVLKLDLELTLKELKQKMKGGIKE